MTAALSLDKLQRPVVRGIVDWRRVGLLLLRSYQVDGQPLPPVSGNSGPAANQYRMWLEFQKGDFAKVASLEPSAMRFPPHDLYERLLRVEAFKSCPIALGQLEKESVVFFLSLTDRPLRLHVDGLVPRSRLVLCRAHLYAEVAAGAVLGRHLNRVSKPALFWTSVCRRLEASGSVR